MLKLNSSTKCQVINMADMRFEFQTRDVMVTFKVFLPDGTMIMSNFCQYWPQFRQNKDLRYFLIDWKDLTNMEKVWEKCETPEEKYKKAEEYLGSVTKFSKHFPKRIYVRLIPSPTVGSEKEKRVFADEVVEIIPIVLRQQKNPIQEDDERLMAYRKRSARVPYSGTFNTFSVSEFEKILDEFDIDKSLITLIPDPSHEMTRREFAEKGGHTRLFAPDKTIVTDPYSAMEHVFVALVMGVNWKNDKCRDHKKCNDNMKSIIISCFAVLCDFPDIYLDCRRQMVFIENVRKECPFTHLTPRACPDYIRQLTSADADSDIETYNMVVNQFDLPMYPVFPPGVQNEKMPVWMHRVLCKLGWIQQFFNEKDDEDQKNMMIETLYLLVPEQHIAATKEFVSSVFNGSVCVIQ